MGQWQKKKSKKTLEGEPKMRIFLSVLRRSNARPRATTTTTGLPFCRSYSRPSFGIAFDIDGVLLRGNSPIGGAPQALGRLFGTDGTLRIPFLFLTNGGGVPESKRASELSRLLGVQILPSQVVQGHSPFKDFVNRFENELVVAVGKGEPVAVMSEYGFKKVISMDNYSSYFEGIDPLAQYKTWEVKQNDKTVNSEKLPAGCDVLSDRVQGVFVVSDPIDWGRDIQVLCDILSTGGLPGKENGNQPPLYFANDDLEYQSTFPSERLGMGAFRLAFECIFNRMHINGLEYTSFGKPSSFVFKNAEGILKQLRSNMAPDNEALGSGEIKRHSFNTLYMIGDNPSVDIQGARKAGHPWFSILTRTGVFKGKENHPQFPADLVVDTVEEAIDFILRKESPTA